MSAPSPRARLFLLALSLLAGLVCLAPAPASARTPYDGLWSVLIVTERGTCDRAYRYPLRIINGRVTYGGEADFTIFGRVRPNGAVTVTVARGDSRATGAGRLTPSYGSGRWRGASSANACAGVWQAERRG